MKDVDGSSDKPTVADPKQHLNRQNELSALFPFPSPAQQQQDSRVVLETADNSKGDGQLETQQQIDKENGDNKTRSYHLAWSKSRHDFKGQ